MTSVMPSYYCELFPGGPRGPLRWQDDISGQMPQAVLAFFEGKATPGQFALVRDYCRYYIDAPCWDWNPHNDDENRAELAAVRASIREVKTTMELNAWIGRCLDMGIDPL